MVRMARARRRRRSAAARSTSTTRTVDLVLPEGTDPGDTLCFIVDGNEIEMEVPPGAKAGDTLQINVDAAAAAGDEDESAGESECESESEEIAIPGSGGNTIGGAAAAAAGGTTSVALGLDGSAGSLNLLSALPPGGGGDDDDGGDRSSLPPEETAGGGTTEKEEEEEEAAVHSEAWPTGLTMAGLVSDPRMSGPLFGPVLRGGGAAHAASTEGGNNTDVTVRVLELGSGLGTVGLSAAVAMSRLMIQADAEGAEVGGEHDATAAAAAAAALVVLTDVASAVPLLRANIGENEALLRGGSVSVEAKALEWGEEQRAAEDSSYDVIIGSDLLYGPSTSYPLLVGTIASALKRKKANLNGSRGGGMVQLGVRWRQPAKERQFFELAENRGIEFVLLKDWVGENTTGTDKVDCDHLFDGMPTLPWSSYGDVENQAFLHHLKSTQVTVEGGKRTVSLYDLSEDDMERMDDKEHSAFERTQMQVYVGRWATNCKRAGDTDTFELEREPKKAKKDR